MKVAIRLGAIWSNLNLMKNNDVSLSGINNVT